MRLNEIIEQKNNPKKENTYTPMPTKAGERIDGRFIQQYLNKIKDSDTIKKKEPKPKSIPNPFSNPKQKRPNIPLSRDKQ